MAYLPALRVDHIRDFLQARGFNVLHTTALGQPMAPVATLLYNNHHAGCLFKFHRGGGLVIDPLDAGSQPVAAAAVKRRWKSACGNGRTSRSRRWSVAAAKGTEDEDAMADSPALWLYAKRRLGHAFSGSGFGVGGGVGGAGDRQLYSFPLKSSPLQSQNSECCMWIAIGLLLAYRWCARGQTQPSIGRLQRLVSFLRKKGRLSDALIRHAVLKTGPYLCRLDKTRLY